MVGRCGGRLGTNIVADFRLFGGSIGRGINDVSYRGVGTARNLRWRGCKVRQSDHAQDDKD